MKIKGKFRTKDFVATQVAISWVDQMQTRIVKKIRSIRQNDQKIHEVITRLEGFLSKRSLSDINGQGVVHEQVHLLPSGVQDHEAAARPPGVRDHEAEARLGLAREHLLRELD